MGGIHSLDGSRNLNEPDAPRCPRQMGVHYCTTQLGLSYSETATTVPALSKGYVSIHSLLEVRECPRTTWWTVFVYIYIHIFFICSSTAPKVVGCRKELRDASCVPQPHQDHTRTLGIPWDNLGHCFARTGVLLGAGHVLRPPDRTRWGGHPRGTRWRFPRRSSPSFGTPAGRRAPAATSLAFRL